MITFLTNKKSKEKYMLIQRKNNHFLIKSDKSITTRFQNKTTDEVKRILVTTLGKGEQDEKSYNTTGILIGLFLIALAIASIPFSSGIVKDAHASSVKKIAICDKTGTKY